MTSDDIKAALLLAATGAVAYLLWTTYRGAGQTMDDVSSAAGRVIDSMSDAAGQAVDAVGEAAATAGGWVNPTADTNIAYRGANGLIGWAVGDANYNLGSAVYDYFNPEPAPIVSGGGGEFRGTGATGSWGEPTTTSKTGSW